ncbi:methionine adenosyltransferase [[Mycoplasma] mobile]|uniref:Methionine adenosyltransferase n=1 Tax=Mycoplasma mobile (strain ATCC 43663 / 163K / NCTC 11711) TaxID=267748 RepID=Q6KHY1_MYCM1|nr:methionine adenosyltransferase [[Mycoplasma] mobile]AAT27795.1 s-adenosylmethionine synthetase [Mycoplasma mobile 163K]
MKTNIFTSESVGKGHPDKICDQISDRILDSILKKDCNARVACEVMASNKLIVIGGEIKTNSYIDVVKEAWNILLKLGYDENDFTIISNINKQSSDISFGVDKSNGSIAAGDQGIVFGYATNETEQFLPLNFVIAHEILKIAEKKRLNKTFQNAKSDMKSQVTMDYSDPKNPKLVTIIVAIQHEKNIDKDEFEKFIKDEIIYVVTDKYKLNRNFEILINTAGDFTIGGPIGDTGLTGRKIIVDTYGGWARHGGGAFSGKDYTKVDRSGAYFARWVAKNLVAAEVADKVEIQFAFAIGKEMPIAININVTNEKYKIELIEKVVKNLFNFNVGEIIEKLDLKKPIYEQVASFGHFGRNDLDLSWEKLDYVDKIKQFLKKYPEGKILNNG